MASTTAALMAAAARRLSRSTASAMVLRDVSGSHKLTIDGCAPSKNLAKGWFWFSRSFDVAGHSWRIRYTPHKGNDGQTIALHLEHDPRAASKKYNDKIGSVRSIKFSVLDQSGNPVPEFTRTITGPCAFGSQQSFVGFDNFVTWKDLEASGASTLKDDRYAVQCDVTVTADLTELGVAYDDNGAAPASDAAVPVTEQAPADKLHKHLADLLWKDRRGADVTVAVGGEATFDTHGWLLAERSPVFKADLELLATSSSKKSNAAAAGAAHRRIEINDMEPKVFEAALHYMYANALPEMDDVMAMAPGLLAAADRFELDGLKLACEVMLSSRIDVNTAAGTLAVAEQHSSRALKAACLEFMAQPENLKAVLETEGYEKAKATIHPIVTELVMKQWLASSAAHHE
ncbi:unnamed protein product [Urochloa humidicola]